MSKLKVKVEFELNHSKKDVDRISKYLIEDSEIGKLILKGICVSKEYEPNLIGIEVNGDKIK